MSAGNHGMVRKIILLNAIVVALYIASMILQIHIQLLCVSAWKAESYFKGYKIGKTVLLLREVNNILVFEIYLHL